MPGIDYFCLNAIRLIKANVLNLKVTFYLWPTILPCASASKINILFG